MKGKIKQICVVSDDAHKTMQEFWDVLGVGPWDVRHFNNETSPDFRVGGEKVEEEFDFIAAVCWSGDIELEVCQPIKGPNVYWDTLERKGTCLHHFKIVIPDNDELAEYVKSMEEKGIKVTQTGWLENDVHYYLDTEEKLGFIVELGNGGDISPAPEIYPSNINKGDTNKRELNVKQIAILTDDVDKYIKNMTDILGVGPWDVRHFNNKKVENFYVDGKKVEEEFDFICAVAWYDDIELEVMQPIKGSNIYWKTLEKSGIGLHHFKDVMPNDELEKRVKEYDDAGYKVIQTGKYENDIHYYLDTKDELGFELELGNGAEIGEPDYRYPKD